MAQAPTTPNAPRPYGSGLARVQTLSVIVPELTKQSHSIGNLRPLLNDDSLQFGIVLI